METDNIFIQAVVILFFVFLAVMFLGMFKDLFGLAKMLLGFGARSAVKKDLLTRGRRVKAEVLSVRQTQTFVNENPEVQVRLRLNDTGTEIDHTFVLPMVRIPQVQPGKEIDVLVDPQDTARIAIPD